MTKRMWFWFAVVDLAFGTADIPLHHYWYASVMLFLAAMNFYFWRSTPGAESSAQEDDGLSTEFVAEIVRIREIRPHGNADKLEVALFDLAKTGAASYEVCVRKGEYRVGDHAAYFSVDCLLPLAHPLFSFLKNPESKTVRAYHRLRAARLRGVYSQGLLVPAPSGCAYGQRVAELFGVSYHAGDDGDVAPAAQNAGAKKTSVQPMAVYGVASLKKAPSMFVEGEMVAVTEKLHGCSYRFGWVRQKFFGIPLGWKFLVGSHRAIKAPGGDGGFYKEDLWTRASEDMRLAEKTRSHRGLVFYGELYGYTRGGKAIQDMTYDRSPSDGPGLVVFDVRRGRGAYLRYEDMSTLVKTIGLAIAPILFYGPYSADLPRLLAEGQSQIAQHLREGCVVGSIDGVRKAKFVGQGYLLRKTA